MKNRKITIICILLIAISLVLLSSICFAETSNLNENSIGQLIGNSIDINNLSDYFKNDYLSEYDNEDLRVIVQYKQEKYSIKEDLEKLNVDCVVNYSYNQTFFGQSITIKAKDILALSKLNYVKSVSICAEYYALFDYSTQSGTNGGIIANETSNQGEGMVVCIIDNAFDTSHIALSNEEYVEETLSILSLENLYKLNAYKISNVTPQELYLSKKIPFVYDYAEGDTNLYESDNHGTHVAGIVAGNSEKISGVVKNAQLVLMKVGDKDGAMYTDTILKALEDCEILNVDTINMSLGSNNGFSYNEDDVLCECLEKLNDKGIDIVCAAGNSYTSAFGSENGDLASAENMDNASIASPASYNSTYSIVNAQETNYVEVGDNKLVFADGYYTKTSKSGNYFKEYLDYININPSVGENLPYYVLRDENNELLLGKQEDYENVADKVENKIVIVKRGEITFTKKIEIAQENGAIGVIVINTSQSLVRAALDNDFSIPFALASKDALDVLMDNIDQNGVGYIKFKEENRQTIINDSSSQGVLNDFTLGVDFAAYGTNIYSLSLNQAYEEMTGTSMAAPNGTGALTSIKQFVKNNAESFNIIDSNKKDISDVAIKLLMSNTKLLEGLNGNYASPRVQGAGLVDLKKALESNAYISVENEVKTKIEIKEDISQVNTLNFEFDIVNASSEQREYTLDVVCLIELLTKDSFMSGQTEKLDVSIKVDSTLDTTVVVNANDKKHVVVEVQLSNTSIEKLSSYPKGTYIDGYILLKGTNTLSCPFVSYYGNWDDLEILDKTSYEVTEEDKAYIRPSTSYGIYAGAYYMPLGEFAYKLDEDMQDMEPQAREEYASLSIYSSAMYSLGYIQLGLLRNAEYIEIQVIDNMTNKVVYTSDHSYVSKTAYLSSYAMMYGGDLFEEISPYALGLDNNKNYTVKVNVYREYEESNKSISGVYEQDFVVDFEAPVIKEIEYSKDNKTATLSIYDNNYPQALLVCTGKGTTATNVSLYVEKVIPIVASDKSQVTQMEIDIQDAMKNATNGYLYYYVVDYAFNYAIYYDKSPLSSSMSTTPNGTNRPNNSTSIQTQELSFKTESVLVNVNEEINLATNTYLQGYDINKTYTWTQSNKDIVALENGKITGLSVGVSVVEVQIDDVKATIIVKVVDEKDFEPKEFISAKVSGYTVVKSLDKDLVFDLDVNKDVIELAPQEEIKFNFDFEPYNYNYVKDPNFTVLIEKNSASSALDVQNNIIKAIEEGEVEITIKVNDTLVKTYLIKVCSSIYIDENNTLRACFDQSKTLDLTGKNIFSIASNAFYYAKDVEKIILPESTKIIYENAFLDLCALSEINLDKVTTIHKNAFKGCSSLKQAHLEMIDQLNDYAFDGCVNLNTVYFANTAQLKKAALSMSAFTNCDRLEYFNYDGENKKSIIIDGKLYITLDYLSAIQEGFTIIGSGSFANINLEEISFTNPIERIEKDAFKNNDIVKRITFNSVQYIGPYAFSGCTALESVQFNNLDNLYVGERAFENSAIKTMDFASAKTTFENLVFFNCKELQYVNMGIVQDIGRYTFALADNLTYVEYMEGSQKIGENTFALCIYNNVEYYHDALKYVKIPSSIKVIDEYAFAYCENLDFEETALSEVEVIKEGAFVGTKINSEIVLNNIEQIESSAFAESSLAKITINSSKQEILIGELAFYKCEVLNTVVLPKDENVSIKIEKGAFYGCIGLYGLGYKISFMNNRKEQFGINLDRATYIGDYAFTGCKVLDRVIINNAEYIGYGAFAECEELTKVEMNNVKYIDDFAFYQSNLKEIEIPATIEYIGESVFNDNQNLTIKTLQSYDNLVIDYTSDNMPIIYTKLEDEKLMLVYYPYKSQDKKYQVKENTSYIGAYAFYKADNLQSIKLVNVERIGHGALYECNGLKSVEMSGVVPQLISSYNSNSSNTYCNFSQEIGSVEGLILVCDETNIDQFRNSYLYTEYFDYIILKSSENATYNKIADFVELLNEKEIESLTKTNITEIIDAYNAMSQAEKEYFNDNTSFSSLKDKYEKITKLNVPETNTLNSNESLNKSLLNLTPMAVIVLFVVIGMVTLAITALLSWYFAQKAMNKKK